MGVDVLDPAVMDRVPGWAGHVRMVEPLSGGITNRNFRVAVGDDIYVVRLPAKTGALLGIDRAVEHEASRLAAVAGVGPDVIAFLEPEGALVTRFINGAGSKAAALELCTVTCGLKANRRWRKSS